MMEKIPRIRVKLAAQHVRLLNDSAQRFVDCAVEGGSLFLGPVSVPPQGHRLRSLAIDIFSPNQETIDALMRLDLGPGVECEIEL